MGELISCRFTHLPFLLSNSGFEMLVTLGLPVSYTPAAPSVWPDKLLKMLLFLQYHSAPWSSSILYGLPIGDLRRSSFFLTNFRGRFKWMVKPHITSWDDLHSGFSSKIPLNPRPGSSHRNWQQRTQEISWIHSHGAQHMRMQFDEEPLYQLYRFFS